VAETSLVSEGSPFHQARPLTSERAQLFARTAESLAERFEDELSRWLSESTVRAGPIRQALITDLVDPETDLAVVKAKYHLTHGVIATDLQLALSLVSMLCGGLGDSGHDIRPLSRLEMGVLDLLLNPLIDLTAELFDLGPVELGTHAANALALPDSQLEPAIGVPLKLAVGSVEGKMTVGLTLGQLQTYSQELDRRVAGRLTSGSGAPNALTVRAVRPVQVELVVGFEPLRVPAGTLAGLQIGDVLRTRQSVSGGLVARIGSERIFNVRAAQRGQRLVAEMVSPVELEPGHR
jgi:flagellar motor switch protein FliM